MADTVDGVKRTLAAALLGCAVLSGTTVAASTARAAVTRPATQSAASAQAASAQVGSASRPPLVVVGVPGLLWSDITPSATPQLWRLAEAGSVGDLVVHGEDELTCPADGWLTLNAGARAMAPRTAAGNCAALPAAGPAGVPSMRALVSYNQQFHWNPSWGLLARAAGPGQCATAIGPGAALALAGPAGSVSATPVRHALTGGSASDRTGYAKCPLTVVDLGAVPASHGTARQTTVRADDATVGRIRASLPAGAILVVAALADSGTAPHLHPIIVAGPGFGDGLLDSAATRQSGLVTLTDLTPTLLHLRGVAVPADAVGSQIHRANRGSLSGTVRDLIGADTDAQVYAHTFGWFFAGYGIADGLAFIGIGLALRGGSPERRRRRAVAWRVAGVFAAAVPVGSFLASLVPWWLLAHPAVWLYALAVGWAAVIGAVALAGPWRREPLAPLGLVAGLTAAVLAADVATGSHLQLGTPFGLSVIVAGRFYGIGNNAVLVYAAAGLFCAGWLGLRARQRQPGRRGPALTAVAITAVVVIGVAGWPGFGAKVGGTFAMVPCFLILAMAVAGVRLTARRAVVALVCGVALVVLFALVNYLVPATGASDIGGFFGQVLHGGAGGTLSRKISSNVGSLTLSEYALIVPPVVVIAGLMLIRPSWFAVKTLPRGWDAQPLLRVILAVIWLVAVLSWFAEDSGVTVVASGLPFVLPLGIAAAAACGLAPDPPSDTGPAQQARQAILDLPP